MRVQLAICSDFDEAAFGTHKMRRVVNNRIFFPGNNGLIVFYMSVYQIFPEGVLGTVHCFNLQPNDGGTSNRISSCVGVGKMVLS